MREQPQGQNLLAIARTTLLEKVVPLIPQDQRYSALMVANAIAIALRQWEAGNAWQREELARLQALFALSSEAAGSTPSATSRAATSKATTLAGASLESNAPIVQSQTENVADPSVSTELQRALTSANRAMSQKIREGNFDTLSQPFAELLEWMAVQRVRESAPKALQAPR